MSQAVTAIFERFSADAEAAIRGQSLTDLDIEYGGQKKFGTAAKLLTGVNNR